MKEYIFTLTMLLMPILIFAQNANLIIQNGAFVSSNAIFDVDGTIENQGYLNNQNEIYLNGDFISENEYDGQGRIIIVSNSNHILCTDTIHDLILNYFTTEINLDDDLYIRDNLTVNEGKVNLTGATLHLNNELYSQNLIINSVNSFFYNGSIRQNLSEDENYFFPLGTDSDYAPISIDVNESDYTNKWIEVELEEVAHPNMPSSNNFLQMYWSISNTAFSPGSQFSIEAIYPDAVISGDESDLKAEIFLDPGWLGTSINSDQQQGTDYFEAANNLIQINAVSDLGDLAIFTRIIGCEGDVNIDGFVNILDLVVVSSNFGCSLMCEGDANGDGQVNIIDLVVVSSNFGNICQ